MYNEFSVLKTILEKIRSLNAQSRALAVQPGDDAALLTPLSRPVVTTDTQREGVHFKLDWQTPFDIGYKAVMAALSDLAASYARPVSVFINLGLPASASETLVDQLYDGVKAALTGTGCAMGGGNISMARELSLDLFALGEGHPDCFPMRSTALPGHGLYVTGPLGLARAGLMCLQNQDHRFPDLIEYFKKPRARFDAADILRSYGVTCVMDVSDGLAGDAGHIARASNLTVSFHIDERNIHPSLAAFCRGSENTPEAMMISGGEDYELLFACLPSVFETIRSDLPQAFQVGVCRPYNGTWMEGLPETCSSYVHGETKGNDEP